MTDVSSLRLSAKQEQAARLIARGWTKAETARDPRVKVSTTTMQRWTNEDELFRKRVEELRTSVDLRATEILQDSLDSAARVVSLVLHGDRIDVDVLCKNCGGEVKCASDCGEDAAPAAIAALKERIATAKWLLDMQYKGKLPKERPQSARGEPEEISEGMDPEDYDDLMRRGEPEEGVKTEDEE